jgi:UDP-2,4-diacetamido-2,4,6-trideoxy-beta-L-altropyranose hydrolase
MNVVFRVDASSLIGTGHVMRCLTLARALRKAGARCRFICREHESNLIASLFEEKFEVIKLGGTGPAQMNRAVIAAETDYESSLGTGWQEDAKETIEAIYEVPDLLIVDHYGIDTRWEAALRPHVQKIMAVDDLANRHHDCDILLDQNLVANFKNRYDSKVPSSCIRLLGPEFSLLQPEYFNLRFTAAPRTGPVKRILISFGGADRANLTGLSVSAFISLGRVDIEVDVVISRDSPCAAQIAHYASIYPNIHVHHSLPTLAHLMLKADLAIGAAGSTSWERCCLGLPAIVVTLAENQKPIAEELERSNLARWIGDSETITEREVSDALVSVIGRPSLELSSRECLNVTDGCGTTRVAEVLMSNVETSLLVRPAELSDEGFLLGLANDSLVRKNAFSSNLISSETHKEWFYRRLRDPARTQIFIVEIFNGLPIGQVRFERAGVDRCEIHYALAPYFRNRGLAAPMLKKAFLEVADLLSRVTIFAKVKKNNLASLRVFTKLNFNQTELSDYVVFTKTTSLENRKYAD